MLLMPPHTSPLLQAVYELYDIVAGPPWNSNSRDGSNSSNDASSAEGAAAAQGTDGTAVDTSSRVVIIGRHLHRAQLQQGLEACAADM